MRLLSLKPNVFTDAQLADAGNSIPIRTMGIIVKTDATAIRRACPKQAVPPGMELPFTGA